jgi:hypothetical protein
MGEIFWRQVRGEILACEARKSKCYPKHGALNASSAGLAFSAVTIAVSEPFILPTAENWCLGGRNILSNKMQMEEDRQTCTTPQENFKQMWVKYGKSHF